MAGLTRAQIRSHARLLAGDASTVTDTEVNAMIDEAAEFIWNQSSPRYTIFTATGTNADDTLDFSAQRAYRTTTILTYYEIASLHYQGTSSTATDGAIVDRIDYSEWALLRQRDLSEFTEAAGPKRWAAVRQRKSGSDDINGTAWNIYLHPASGVDTAYISIRTRRERAAFSGDSDVFDGTAADTYAIARLVAWEIAAKIGRGPSRLDWIAWPIPENLRILKGIKLHAAEGVTSVDND